MEVSRPGRQINYRDIRLMLWISFIAFTLICFSFSMFDVTFKIKEFFRNVAYYGATLLALSGTFLAGMRSEKQQRRLWLTLSAAILVWSLGDSYIGFQQFFTGLKGITRPSAADALYVVAYILFVTVAYFFARISKTKTPRRRKIDIQYVLCWSGLFVASVIIAWGMILNPIYQSVAGGTRIGILEELYPILDIAIVVSLLGKYFKEPSTFWEKSEVYIVIGVTTFMVADIVYHFLAITGAYRVQNLMANVLCIIWLMGDYIIFMGALYKIAWDNYNKAHYTA
jgi:hypothetical protein